MKTSKKAAGFYVTLFSCILAIASAICYGVLFKGIEYKEPVFDMRICVIMAAVGIVAAILLLVNERIYTAGCLCRAAGGHPGGLRSGAVHEEVPVRLMERTRREENSQ